MNTEKLFQAIQCLQQTVEKQSAYIVELEKQLSEARCKLYENPITNKIIEAKCKKVTMKPLKVLDKAF